MDAHSRRQLALDAIAAVAAGSPAGDLETEVVDFKEERGTISPTGDRAPIDPRDDQAARAIAAAAACMSNSDQGGVLVVGVNDKAAGPAAFVDTYLDTTWLRRRVHELTTPHLSVDVIEEIHQSGHRLYLVNVHPGLEEVRSGGRLRTRQGTQCVELTGDQARLFLERRRNFDWSAEASGVHLSAADRGALDVAAHHYRASAGRTAGSDLELVRRLGVAIDDTDDPELNRAGALLISPLDHGVDQIRVLATRAEGVASDRHEDFRAPLLTAFDEAWQVIDDAFEASSVVVGRQRRAARAIPEAALREALVNAVMHRDYRHANGCIVVSAIGSPPDVLKVVSPGGFVPGVRHERLLAVSSQPRNPALARAMRTLGLSEIEGIGVDTMYRVLLRDGHPAPEITEDGGDVTCRLSGGAVDRAVRGFFDTLYDADPSLEDDARAHIVVTELLSRTPVRADDLVGPAQCSTGEANAILDQLVRAGAVERLVDGSRSFRLTHRAQDALRSRITYPVRKPLDESWEVIRAFLDTNPVVGQHDVVALLGVQPVGASRILGQLRRRGDIEAVANTRGRGVRYRLAGGGRGSRKDPR